MKSLRLLFAIFLFLCFSSHAFAQRYTDNLGRGLVAIPTGSTSGSTTNLITWRRLADEYYDVTYNLYKDGSLLASNLTTTCYADNSRAYTTTSYQVAAVVREVEQTKCTAITPWAQYVYKNVERCATGYIDISLATVYDRDGADVTAHYLPNDAEVADLDGDGELEIIVKRLNTYDAGDDGGTKDLYATDSKEFVVFDAYDVNWQTGAATLMWRIDCGPNMVSLNSTEVNLIAYDWDEDGKAEVVLRGAENMLVLGSDGHTVIHTVGSTATNTRNALVSHSTSQYAWTHTGNEYLIYLNGQTGALYQQMAYPLKRLETGEADENSAWGDGYGHRSSKYFMGAPFLDGRKASLFLARGIYTRHKMMALDLNRSTHQWSERWSWACSNSSSSWFGNGYHNFVIADVDEDGRDEIVYGSMVIDDNGRGLSTTGLGHGDAQHVSDFDPYRKGLEFFGCNEDKPGMNYRNATTSEIYVRKTAGEDDGRGLMANFSNLYPGSQGRSVSTGFVSSVTDGDLDALAGYIDWSDLNFRIYFDGDLCSEVLNSPGVEREAKIDKPGTGRLFTSSGCNMNNDSKNNPCFQGDLIGDWREEIIVRCGSGLRVYTSGMYTSYSMPSLWFDHQYRQAMVWQMHAYNQPPHLSYFLGELEGITQAPPSLTNQGRTEVPNSGTITTTSDHLLLAETNNMSVSITDGAAPYMLTVNTPSWVQGSDNNNGITTTTYTHTLTGGRLTGSMSLIKQGDGTLVLPNVAHTYTGATNIWGGTLVCNGTLSSPVWLNRFTTLLSSGGAFGSGITADYGASIIPGGNNSQGTISTTTMTLNHGARLVLDIYNDFTSDQLNVTSLVVNTKTGDAWTNYGPSYLKPVIQLVQHGGEYTDGRWDLGTLGGVTGSLSDIILEGTAGLDNPRLERSDGHLYLRVGTGEPVIRGDFYLCNMAAQKYLAKGSSYDTHATVDGAGVVVTFSGSAGDYLIHFPDIAANKYLDANGWVDRESGGDGYTTWTLEAVEGEDNTYKLKANTNNNYLQWNGGGENYGNEVTVAALPDTEERAYWVLVPQAERVWDGETSLWDFTYLVTDPDMEASRNSMKWTHTNFQKQTSAQPYCSGVFLESWVTSGTHLSDRSAHQTIDGLPGGAYRMTIAASALQQSGGETVTGAYVYAGDAQTAVTTAGDYTVNFICNSGSVEIGFKTVNTTANWVYFDNVRLTYLEPCISTVAESFVSGDILTAGQWYAFSVEGTGEYTFSATEGIVITDDGTQLLSEAAGDGVTSRTLLVGGVTYYVKSTTTQVLSITFQIDNGTYYLYDESTGLFLSRGGAWGTEATVDSYGIPFEFATLAGVSAFTFLDGDGMGQLFDNGSGGIYTDNTSTGWRLRPTDGGFYVCDASSSYYLAHADGIYGRYVTTTTNEAEATVWTMKTMAEHNTIVAAYPVENATRAIEDGGRLTTAAELVTYLSGQETATDMTHLIGTASFTGSIGSWEFTKVRSYYRNYIENNSQPAYGTGWAEVYEATGWYQQTIDKSNLPKGLYKLTMDGFERENGTYDLTTAYLAANGEQVRLKSWNEVHDAAYAADNTIAANYPVNTAQASACFTAGYATNEVYIYLDGNTDLTITLKKPNYVAGDWMIFNNFTLTRYNSLQEHEEVITSGKGDITSLINGDFQQNANGWTGGTWCTWVANRGWRGTDYSNNHYERGENGVMSYTLSHMPAGNYKVVAAARTYAGGKIVPQIAGSNGTALTGVGDVRTDALNSAGAREINLNGVEMPYNGTTSALGGFTTNDYGHNWRWITATGTLAEDGDLVINFQTTGTTWMAIDDVHLYCTQYNGINYTVTAPLMTGNTVVNTNNGTGANREVLTCDIVTDNPNAIVRTTGEKYTAAGQALNNNMYNSYTINRLVLYDGYDYQEYSDGDVLITNGATLYRTLNAGQWYTLMLPFYPANIDVKKVPSDLSEDGVLTFIDAPVRDMNNEPMLVMSTTGVTEITGTRNGTTGIGYGDGDHVYGAGAPMHGTYETIYNVMTYSSSQSGENCPYVVARKAGEDTDKLYRVTSVTGLRPFRAYFYVPEGGLEVKEFYTLNFDGVVDRIESFYDRSDEGVSTIFDLSGRRVAKTSFMKKGVYIIDGKKTVIR